MRARDAGSASVWVLTAAALVLVVAGIASVRAGAVVARHRADSAADLAAVAAAGRIGVDGRTCEAARVIAARNDAVLTACAAQLSADTRSGSVFVSIRLLVRLPLLGSRSVVATARAGRLAPVPP